MPLACLADGSGPNAVLAVVANTLESLGISNVSVENAMNAAIASMNAKIEEARHVNEAAYSHSLTSVGIPFIVFCGLYCGVLYYQDWKRVQDNRALLKALYPRSNTDKKE